MARVSEQSIVALIAVITSGILGLASLWFNFWNSSRERALRLNERRFENDEWYKRTLFEKRLLALQQAYEWLMKINEASNRAQSDKPDSLENSSLREICKDARSWYDSNTIYLNNGLPDSSEYIGLIKQAAAFANGTSTHGPWTALIAASKGIQARVDQLLRTNLD